MAIYSPAWLTDAARKVMGSIDLDPASCLVANAIVRAKKFFTVEQDGLSQTWSGNVYLNPPFEEMSSWLVKLRSQKTVKQAIVVGTFAVSGYEVFQWYWQHALFLVPDHRIKYWHPIRPDSSPRSFVLYLGPHRERFIEVFGRYGVILGKMN